MLEILFFIGNIIGNIIGYVFLLLIIILFILILIKTKDGRGTDIGVD